ncbi:hypothetical protein DFQ28_003538 [Apophysomyces sp. BC1034]|nr:hypothetical protein DFQ30_007152 [Apophysomyces sp. BC1015]KAG0179074.1 hypothetical protein DFQ29_002653 [Apophysomyces sp. BC1021]KAG0189337.1 hypothetical protein DFQ28_003538 [Apophysomyces sp. BC1034]
MADSSPRHAMPRPSYRTPDNYIYNVPDNMDNSKRRFTQSAPHPSGGQYRDTTINIATAFNQAHGMTSPTQRISPASQRKNVYFSSPALQPNTTAAQLDSDLDGESIMVEHNRKDQEREMDEFFCDSDDDSDPYEEENFLAENPREEKRRWYVTQEADSCQEDMEWSESDTEEVVGDDDGTSSAESQVEMEKSKDKEFWPQTKRVFDTTFEFIMFGIFMVFWTIKEMVVALVTYVFLVVSRFIVRPVMVVLYKLGFNVDVALPDRLGSRGQTWVFVTFSAVILVALVALGKPIDTTEITREAMTYPQQALSALWDWTHGLMDSPLRGGSYTKPTWIPSNADDVVQRLMAVEDTLKLLTQGYERMKQTTTEPHKEMEQLSSFAIQLEELQGLLQQEQLRMQEILTRTAPADGTLSSVQSRLGQLEESMSKTNNKQQNMDEYLKAIEDRVTDKSELERSVRAAIEQELLVRIENGNVNIHPGVDTWLKKRFATHGTMEKKLAELRLSGTWDGLLERYHDAIDNHVKTVLERFMQDQMEQGSIISKEALRRLLTDEITRIHKRDREPVAALVESMIQQYHQDGMSEPDFALASRGSRIIPRLTSSTYVSYPRSRWIRGISKLTGFGRRAAASPLTVLTPNVQAGECWAMDGTSGTLAIELCQPVVVQSITFEHLARQMAINMNSAPKDIEIWGLKSVPGGLFRATTWPWETNDANAVLLGTFRYDIKRPVPIQTFDLETKHYTIFKAVLVRVISNWGNDAYTCLYRVRVHGVPVEQPK